MAVALLVASAGAACGKRGDPLPPFRRNPEPVQRLELAQRGEAYELAFVAPTRTIDGAPLPVLDVEVLISAEAGVLDDLAEPIRLKAAPGERVIHQGSLPPPGTPLRFAVRTRADGKPSPLSPESLLVVKAVPPAPSDVSVRATSEGLSLTWTECVPTTPEPPPPEDAAAPPEDEDEDEGEADAIEDGGEEEREPDAVPAAGPPRRPGEPAAAEAAAPGAAARGGEDVPPQRGPEVTDAPGTSEPAEAAAPADHETATSGTRPEPADDTAAAATPPAPAPSPGVRLYRRSADGEYEEPLVASALATEAYLDTDVEHGEELCYRLRTLLRGEPLVESADSAEVCATFLDRQPPASPTGLSVLRLDDSVELAWSPLPDGAEVPAAIHVHRAVGNGPLERIAELEGGATRWIDPEAPADAVVEYALTATDVHGNESAPSERARLIPR